MKRIADLVRVGRRSLGAVLLLAAAIVAGGCETSSTVSSGPTPVKCQVSLGSSAMMMEALGGTGSVGVTAQPECAWEASTSANWISALSPTSGQGNGEVTFRVAPNDGTSVRDGNVVVNGQQVVVSQRAPCRYALTPANQNVSANGGAGSVSIATADDCAWTASTDASWITLTPPLTGRGNGTVAFTVLPSTGEVRTDSITIAGQRATVTQGALAPACSNASITPTNQSIGAAGGVGTTINVSAPTNCTWTAVSNAPWITVTSGGTDSGNGPVTFFVGANTGAARTGTLTIAGRVFTVSQAAAATPPPPCTYSIASAGQTVPAAGGTGTVAVSTGAGCTWTSSSGAPWITITSGATGTGNGSVGFSVAANTGALRTATLTIAGQTFTVTQVAVASPPPPPCTYSIASPGQTVPAAGGTGTVAVSTGASCTWTSTSGAPWITITSGATGTGNGSVGFSVAANTGPARTGTLTIAGQTFTVTQDAVAPPPCTYSIAPPSQGVDANANTGTVTVTAGSGCTWTAASNAPWLSVTSGAIGTGNGSVGFSVAANTGAARTGTLTIAGQTFTVTQAAIVPPPCMPSISPTSQNFVALGGSGTVTVTTGSTCTWTATSGAQWITITSGASGTGSGPVVFSVAVNVGVSRTGTLTIAGQAFTVTQDAVGPLAPTEPR